MVKTGNKNTAFFMIILIAALLCAGGVRGDLPFQEDSCIYLSLAQSMVRGLGYTYTVEPQDRPANYHPPGYPAMLFPLAYFLPRNYIAPRILSIALAMIFLVIIFYSFGAIFKDPRAIHAIFVAALLAFNALFIFYSRQVLTEIPYLLFSFITVYFLELYSKTKRAASRYLFIAAFSMAAAFYTRSIGISLAIAALIYFMFQREIRKGVSLAPVFFIFILPWIYYGARISKNSYIAEFEGATKGISELFRRVIYNLAATVGKELPDLFFYPFLNSIDPRAFIFIFKFLFGSAIALLLVWGFLKKIRENGVWFFDVYSLVYLCFYFSWTHHGSRYLIPLLPFLLYYLFFGIKSLVKRESIFKGVIYLIISINIAGGIKEIIRERNDPYLPEERSFISAVDWLKNNAPRKSVIVSRRNNFVYMYTNGLRGLKLLITTDTRRQYNYIMDNKVDYIVIDRNKIYRDDARDYLLPLVRDYPDSFELGYLSREKPETWVYKVKRGI